LGEKEKKNVKKKSRQGKQNKTDALLSSRSGSATEDLVWKISDLFNSRYLINQLTAKNVFQAWERSRDQNQIVFLLLVAIAKNMLHC